MVKKTRFDMDVVTDYICEQIMEGRSLRSICSDDIMDLPSPGYFLRLICENEELEKQYTRARGVQMDYYADEINQIADDCIATTEQIQKAKLRIDSRKWTASKLKPKKYGDKVDMDIKSDGEKITSITREIIDVAHTD